MLITNSGEKKKMKKIFVVLSVAVLALSVVNIDSAEARSAYLNAFNSQYATSNTALDICVTCHGSTKSVRNPYGQDVEAGINAGSAITDALVNIEALDSDGDGFINIDEISALTFPGDAGDFPTVITCTDNDSDGFAIEGGDCGPVDCNDADPLVNSSAAEVCDDNLDNDCNGTIDCQDSACATVPSCITCTDSDGDGYAIEGGDCGPVDCNDADLSVQPGAVENCTDGIDNDCDDLIDCVDGDCSGVTVCDNVCIPEASQEKGKKCSDGIDNDCDGVIDGLDPDCIKGKK